MSGSVLSPSMAKDTQLSTFLSTEHLVSIPNDWCTGTSEPVTLYSILPIIHLAFLNVSDINMKDRNDSNIHDTLAKVNTKEYIWENAHL